MCQVPDGNLIEFFFFLIWSLFSLEISNEIFICVFIILCQFCDSERHKGYVALMV
jgi:hypothetical protein